jgi:TonB family protein
VSTSYVPIESLLESRTFRRLMAASLAGHVLLFAGLTFNPFRRNAQVFTANPVMVSVVAAPPQARPAPAKAAPKPAPKPPEPKAAPPPPPPKPVVNEIVIPKEPAPLAKPKPKPAKPEPAPKTAEQLLAELTEKVEAEHPDSVPDAAPAPEAPAAPAGGPGVFDPAMAAWQMRVKSLIHSNWSGAQICKDTPIFDLEIDSAGGLESLALAKSSGDRYCDESAERAVRKSIPLPAAPRGAIEIELVLNPKAAL